MSYERGLELIRAGDYFEAHEELETAWRAAEPAERDFLQGLVHVAVAWYQAGRENQVGCERQLEKAPAGSGPTRRATAASTSPTWSTRSSGPRRGRTAETSA